MFAVRLVGSAPLLHQTETNIRSFIIKKNSSILRIAGFAHFYNTNVKTPAVLSIKTSTIIMKNMRNPIIALCILLASSLALTSCRKDAEDIQAILSNSEAAEVMEIMITERTAGMTTPTIDMAAIVESVDITCGVTGDTAYTLTKSVGATTYSRNFNMSWLVTCNNVNIPQSVDFDVNGTGTFTGLNWTGSTTSTGEMAFTGLGVQATDYNASGSYQYTGTFTGDLRRTDPSVNCVANLALTNLVINKSTQQITGGTGTATLTATSASGQTATFNVTIVFNGNGSVTVEVNGHSHTFQVA